MKILYILLLIFLNICTLHSQNNFEFTRSWGTYYGPIGGGNPLSNFDTNNLRVDSNQNIYLTNGVLNYGNSQSVSYFDSFILNNTSSLPFLTQLYNHNIAEARFSPMGALTFYNYNGLFSPSNTYSRKLSFVDHNNNKYYQYLTVSATLPISPTSGAAWPTSFPNIKLILAKYDTNDQLLWSTYIPTAYASYFNDIEVDNDSNIYISGITHVQQNIATPGTFSPSYITMYDNYNNLLHNGYLIKLNPQGQKIWGTYLPTEPAQTSIINDQIIFFIHTKLINSPITLTTTGTHQTTKGDVAILCIDGSTGQRNWGTYYGPTNASDSYTIRNMAVTESGVYLTGDDFSSNNYFGTTGSHKPQKTSNREMFITKFDFTGNRLWSSYFGGSGSGYTYCSQITSLAVIGDEAFICGNIMGQYSNIATVGAYQTTPEYTNTSSNNFFFAKFLSDGQLGWASYYGGTNHQPKPSAYIEFQNINIATNNNSLYLYGNTDSYTGFASNNAWLPQPNLQNGQIFSTIGFLAKFDLKTLSTNEIDTEQNITLYNNPNNGNFTITGQILGKNNNTVTIYDTSGRLIHLENFSKTTKKTFNLHSKLNSGQYTLELKQNNQTLKTFKIVVRK